MIRSPTARQPVIVLGGTSLVGPHLCAALGEQGFEGEATSRRPPDEGEAAPGFAWRRLVPRENPRWTAPEGAVVLSTLPIWHLEPLLPSLGAAARIVALSSTSRWSKEDSTDLAERRLAERLAAAESALERFCVERRISWTVLRPTLVYDEGRDRNVTAVASFVRRFGFFPVAGAASGLRQPIRAREVADALAAAVANPAAADRAFDLPGGETLAYRTMVRRVFEALGRRPLIVPLPGAVLRLGLRAGGPMLGARYSPAVFARMNEDLCFDGTPARAAFGVVPGPFRPRFGALRPS